MTAPLSLAIEERPAPVAGPKEVLLDIEAVGVCGSDIHGFAGETGRRSAGMVMGHEIGARIAACAEDPTLIGQVATVFPAKSCGICARCSEDLPALCAEAKIIGVSPQLPGGFAEHLVVPWSNLVPMPGATPEQAALVEPLAVGWHAARLGEVGSSSVAIIGAGGIGIMTGIAAQLLGASNVYVLDLAQDRCDQARRMGLQAPTDAAVDPQAWLREVHGGLVDVVIDAVGTSASLRSALSLSRKGGNVVVVGLGAPNVELALFDLVTTDRRLIGSFCYSRSDFMAAAAQVRAGKVTLADDTYRVVGFDEASAALGALARGLDHALRVFISPHHVAEAAT